MTESLFPEMPDPVEPAKDERTAGQRMRDRQAARIARGYHPLGEPLRLHELADPVEYDDGGRKESYRCGTCAFRILVGGHARAFPKCNWGYREIPIPPEARGRFGSSVRIVTPRASKSATSDVRAWWPACVDYEPEQ